MDAKASEPLPLHGNLVPTLNPEIFTKKGITGHRCMDVDTIMCEEGAEPEPTLQSTLSLVCTVWNVRDVGRIQRACRHLLKHYPVDILAILELEISGLCAQMVCDKLPFTICVRVEVVGFGGGLWMCWNEADVELAIVTRHESFNHVTLDSSSTRTHLIVVIGTRRLGFVGPKFTWNRRTTLNIHVAKHLDRFFTNVQGQLRWSEAIVRHLPPMSSNHHLLYLIILNSPVMNRDRRPFRFKAY
ncbi:LOW QUALITY PROTEIN: hypothetical protein V2J09_016131 [Rumex salicifolius]